jgi:hypothetical protein
MFFRKKPTAPNKKSAAYEDFKRALDAAISEADSSIATHLIVDLLEARAYVVAMQCGDQLQFRTAVCVRQYMSTSYHAALAIGSALAP